MDKYFSILGITALILLSGCIQAGNQNGTLCAQVVTPAIAPDGTCKEFSTPCDVPVGYTIADSCPAQEPNENPEEEPEICAQVITPAVSPDGECVNFPTPCDVPFDYVTVTSCNDYQQEQPNEQDNLGKDPAGKFDFDSELVFCEYDALFEKFTLFYQIRNRTNNIPTYQSKIWMMAPEVDYAQAKTIQGRYTKDRILWEDQQYTYVSTTYRGQAWDIRNVDSNAPVNFQLIYCEPEFSEKEQCNTQTGILLAQGNTAEICTLAGQIS